MNHHIHFIGIGGIGVSALAQYYRSQGWAVSGSDASQSEVTDGLEARGITIFIGHDAAQVGDAEKVIYSAAVRNDNSEFIAAEEKHIPILSYAEAIGELTRTFYTIGVSGSHGKSTTTALIGLVLTHAGFDPTIIVGTKLKDLEGTNFRLGNSKYLVLEADEWNRSFLNYTPSVVVLTNIDNDHLDTYGSLEGVIEGFRTYLSKIPERAVVIANGGNEHTRMLAEELEKAGRHRVIFFNTKEFERHQLTVPGFHNQLNAEAAWQVANMLGISRIVTEEAFQAYQGAWRRLEEISHGIYSDYAHHPTEVIATLSALREQFPQKKIVAVFQPHHQDRFNRLFDEFVHAFDVADVTIILPIYVVKGREFQEGKTPRDLVQEMNKPQVVTADSFETLGKMLEPEIKIDAIIVCMSAGDLDAWVRKTYLK